MQYGGVPFETVNVMDENNNPGVREAHGSDGPLVGFHVGTHISLFFNQCLQ